MRGRGGRHGGDYGGGRRPYGGGAPQMYQQHHQTIKSEYYHGRPQEQPPLGENDGGLDNQQWRWEGDDALPLTAMSPTAPFSEGQGREMPKSYYHSQRLDPQVALEHKGVGGGDPRSQTHEEDMDIGYEDTDAVQTYEALEQSFFDDIIKLSKEHTSAEDAENARHREALNTINEHYEKQLAAIRAQHASRRQEFLQTESQARQQQYQQMLTEHYPSSSTGHGNPQGFNAGTTSGGEPHNRVYHSNSHDSYRERVRLPGNARGRGYEPNVAYPRGRAYNNTRSHHY